MEARRTRNKKLYEEIDAMDAGLDEFLDNCDRAFASLLDTLAGREWPMLAMPNPIYLELLLMCETSLL
jgi:hypothetical protein